MFIVSKLFWLLAQPLSLIFFLLLFGLVLGRIGLRHLRSLLTGLAAFLLFVTLFTSTGTVALQQLENRFHRPADTMPAPACMIVLGGAFENEVMASRGGTEFNQAADRFIEAARLARRYPAARILISGGDGSFSGVYSGDAQVAGRFFADFDIGPERLLLDETSRTTYENAGNAKALLDRQGLSNCLLITSAFHMPRSVGLFRKLGVAVTPWPADYRTSGQAVIRLDFSQPSLNAQLTTTALKEWTGLLAYYLAGRTHTLFPG